ncbi:hypothetical protein G6L37_01725 [Agrobacterium rubi]|nr:hypothetical protein [Agrobacterium rubi]NTF24113.1 hypothetical protein [Agrobacterium rubi]
MTNANRGYDDTRELLAMAVGLARGTYRSVEHAARSVLKDPTQSNVDRLRRKYRQHGWAERGRAELLREHGTGTGPDQDDAEFAADFFNLKRMFLSRALNPLQTIRTVFSGRMMIDMPPIPMLFISSALILLPVFAELVRMVLGLPPKLDVWVMALMTVLSSLSLSVSMVALEEWEGYPNSLEEDVECDSIGPCPN